MPICPWPQLIVFTFGAGSSLLIVSLIGAVAYNGKFGDDNKFRKYSYGWDQKFGQLAVANVSLAVFTIVFVMMAIFFNIKHFPKAVQIVFWVIADFAFIGTIVSQGLSIEWSKYGDAIIPSKYDYFNDKKFNEFVRDKYQKAENGDAKDTPALFTPCTLAVNTACFDNITGANVLFNFNNMPYFFSNFTKGKDDNTIHSVPQCWIDWGKASPVGIDPCNWVVKDGKCIGGWTPENFKNYWCFAYRQRRDRNKDLLDKSEEEKRQYYANKQRAYLGVDSYDAFFEINNIFIGLECSGFGLTTATLFILLCINPFDKERIHYKKIEASGSGSSQIKKTKKKGGSSGSGSS